MAPTKDFEKKIIDDKVAKVREVVDNAPTNDIIMVLHSFDMDVNKTIQAFCEDGAESILGDWVTSSGLSVTAAKKKKNKNKKATNVQETSNIVATPAPAPAPAPSNAPARKPQAASVNKPTNNVPQKSTENESQASNEPLSIAFQSLRNAINEREKVLKQLLASNPKCALSLDTSSLVKAISTFGQKTVANDKPSNQNQQKVATNKTVSPPPTQQPIKHATSQSSITSSVGADSGVNLSPTHKDEKKVTSSKPKTVVSNGGLELSSKGLSSDQLAALQQTLQLSLAARGLDASVLTSSENVSRRPRANKNENKKSGKNNNQKEQPKLSIL